MIFTWDRVGSTQQYTVGMATLKMELNSIHQKVTISFQLITYCGLLELFDEIKFNWTSILKAIVIKTTDKKSISKSSEEFKWSRTPILYGCQYLDLSDYFDLKTNTPSAIEFYFVRGTDTNVEILIQEKNRASTKRLIPSNFLGKKIFQFSCVICSICHPFRLHDQMLVNLYFQEN